MTSASSIVPRIVIGRAIGAAHSPFAITRGAAIVENHLTLAGAGGGPDGVIA